VVTRSRKSKISSSIDSKNSGAARSWFLWVAPFFLPAFFYLSTLFAFISPIAFFIVTLKNRTWVSLLALFTNAAIIFAVDRDLESLSIAIWFWFSVGITFPLFIRKLKKVPVAFFLSFSLALLLLFAGVAIVAHGQGLGVTDYLRAQLTFEIDHLLAIPEHPFQKWVEENGKSSLIHNLMTELPSGLMIALIICYWFNLLLAFRTLPGFLSRAFWGSYRNPEWLVWPTLLSAGLYAFTEHAPYYIGMNGLKVLLMFYGFQGLSIVTFFLNRRQIFGFFRALIYGFLIFLASPFTFALGFFDLWFDFRRKFGQS